MGYTQLADHIANLNPPFRHAGRSTVQTSDVLMLGRRNEGLDQILREFVEAQHDQQRQEHPDDES